MTFSILKNLSKSMEDDIKRVWLLDKDNLKENNWPYTDRNGMQRHMDDYALSDDHPLLDAIEEKIKVRPFVGAYMVTSAKCGYHKTHIDHGRGCGINIPVIVDTNNSLFYSHPQKATPEDWESHSEFKPEDFVFYDMRNSILMDSKCMHGFANWADSDRVIFTFSFKKSYEEILSLIPKDWF